MRRYSFLFILLIVPTVFAVGQQTREVFGKNRLQYVDFDWKYYSSLNFDVYYYGNGGKSALKAVEFLEEEFERITDVVGYSPYFKTKIFIFNSIEEKLQSNVGVNEASHRIGGQTNFVKSYVEVANQGSILGLKKELVSGVTKLVLDDMLFGGSLTDMWQSTYLMSLPDWFVNGAIYYLSRGWDVDMDDHIRDLMTNGAVNKLNKLSAEESAFVGQSLWNFIVQKYGKNNINQILNLVRVLRSEEKSIAFTLGVPFSQIMLEWEEYYTAMANEVAKNYIESYEENSILTLASGEHISSLALSPNSDKLAYAITHDGKHQVYVKEIASGKTHKIIDEGYKIVDQELDKNMPIIDWQDDKTVGIVTYQKGNYVLLLYDIESNSKLISPLNNLEKINSLSFSGTGRLAVLSANRAGKTDLYLLSVRRNKIRRLTNDYFDDLDPKFIPNTNTIVFSSNRITDSLKVVEESLKNLGDNFNNFTFNLDTTKMVLTRLTNTISYDFAPTAKNEDEFYYLSNQKGITNLFRYSLVDSLYIQVTNFSKNIRLYDANFDQNKIVYVALDKQKEHLYFDSNFNFSASVFTPLTPRQQIQQVNFLSSRRLQAAKNLNSNPLVLKEKSTELKIDVNSLDSTYNGDVNNEKIDDTGLIDTDNYVFDKEVVQKKKETGSFLSNYKRIAYSTKVKGPFTYEPTVSADNLITSWVIDPIRGFGVLMETQMNDMLGNHKFLSGAMVTTDFKSGDVYAEYQYLKNLVDYSVRYERNTWHLENNSAINKTLSIYNSNFPYFPTYPDELIQKYAKNTFEVSASLPFTAKTRLSIKPFYTYTSFQDLNPYVLRNNAEKAVRNGNSYLGISTEVVYDNSIVRGQNMIEGTRLKVKFKHSESISERNRSFSNFSLDFRHYQKIVRSLVFASRVYYGSFFGRYKHNYLLGGMDNWLFKSPHAQNYPWLPGISAENNGLYFLEHVTSLRGYDYNTFYGSNVLVANLELRVPLAHMVYSGPIGSSFIKNLQFVGFFDIGSSWKGISPFNEDNNISTVIIKDSNFEAQIQTFKSPWLAGYGIGMRSMIFGYFMKFDLAFPYEDNQTGDAKFYVTLGHDF